MSTVQTSINLRHRDTGLSSANSTSRATVTSNSFKAESTEFDTTATLLTPTYIANPKEYYVETLEGDTFLVSLDGDSTYPIAVPLGEAVLFSLDTEGNTEVSTIVAEADVGYDTSGIYFDLTDRDGNVARVWWNTAQVAAKERSNIFSILADNSGDLDGTYFTAQDSAGSVGIWIDVDDSGTTIPAGASASDRDIEVTGVVMDDTGVDVAQAVWNALDADGAWDMDTFTGGIASVSFEDPIAGPRTDITDGDTGFMFETPNNGAAQSVAPATPAGGRLLQIDSAVNTSAENNAIAIAAIVDADDEFSAPVPTTDLVTITDLYGGTRTDISAGTTGWTVATTNQGVAIPVIYGKSRGTSQVQVAVVPN